MLDSNDIQRLLDTGCISHDQAEKIKNLYGLSKKELKQETSPPIRQILTETPPLPKERITPPAPRPESPLILFIKRNYLSVILSVLGAFLILGGLSMLTIANWENTPRWVKMLEAIAIMSGFWAGGFYLKEIKGKFAKTGIALYVIAACMWGICLKSYSYLYQVSSPPSHGILLFSAGIAFFPWVLRIKALFAIFMVSVLLFGSVSMTDADAPWAFRSLVPLLGLCFWGLGVAIPFFAKGYYSLYSRMSKITGLGVFLFSLLYARVQDWGSASALTNSLPLALIGVAVILWDYFDESDPRSTSQATRLLNRKTIIYGAASILALLSVEFLPSKTNWIALMILAISSFFLSGKSSKTEQIILLIFLFLLCFLPPSYQESQGSTLFFRGCFIAPLLLALSLLLRKQGNFLKEARVVNNISVGFYMALAGYSACEPHLLPNSFISALQIATPWIFALTLFIRERDKESLFQSAVMLCITIAALLGSTDIGFWISTALLIYLFHQGRQKCLSSIIFSVWLYGCLASNNCYNFSIIALFILLISLVKRGKANKGFFAESLIESIILLTGICLYLNHSLNPLVFTKETCLYLLPLAGIPLCFWIIEKWKERDFSLISIAKDTAFLLIIPSLLVESNAFFPIIFSSWAFLTIAHKAISISDLIRKETGSFSGNIINQIACLCVFFILFFILSYQISDDFFKEISFSCHLLPLIPGLAAVYTASAFMSNTKGHTRQFCETIVTLCPALATLISLTTTSSVQLKELNASSLFFLLPWGLGFALLAFKREWICLPSGIATLLILIAGILLPGWVLIALLGLLLLISFIGKLEHPNPNPNPFLLQGFSLIGIILLIHGKHDLLSLICIPLALIAGSLLLQNKTKESSFLKNSGIASLLIIAFVNILHSNEPPSNISLLTLVSFSSIALAWITRLGMSIQRKTYSFPIITALDHALLLAISASLLWLPSPWTAGIMLGYGLFRLVSQNKLPRYSFLSSVLTSSALSLSVFIYLFQIRERETLLVCLLYTAILLTAASGELRQNTQNTRLAVTAKGLHRLGQIMTPLFFLILTGINYTSLSNINSFPWLLATLIAPSWMIIKSSIKGKTFHPTPILLILPLLLYPETIPAPLRLVGLALCGLAYIISGYRQNGNGFQIVLGFSLFAALPMGLSYPHGAFHSPLPFIILYLPILLMTAGFYSKEFNKITGEFLWKSGMIILTALSQIYCYKDSSTTLDWSTLSFFTIPGLLMIYPLFTNRKDYGYPLILIMIIASMAAPIICPNFSLGFVIAILILMGASFLLVGMKTYSASCVTCGIIMMSLVSFSVVFRVFGSNVERGLSLLISGIAFLVLAFIAERTRHYLLKQIGNQSDSTES